MQSLILRTLLFLSLLSLSAEASYWKLQNMNFKYTDSVHEQYIYVPQGEYFYNNELVGDIYGSDYHSYAEVYLDDKLIRVFPLRDKVSFRVTFPPMKSGFHKITILGLPDTLVLSIKNKTETYCPKMRELPFGLNNVYMIFDSKVVAPPQFNKYQEALFNPAFPSDIPLQAALVFDEETPIVLSAATRMIGGIKQPMRGINFTKGETNTTDFSLVFKKLTDSNVSSYITIERKKRVYIESNQSSEIEPARLTFYYKNNEDLLNSVNALLNKKYLKPLDGDKITINTPVEEPQWGMLKEYKTLRELGVNDTKLIGDGTTSLLLNYPIYWKPIDRLHGTILIRSQVALPQDTHLNIWLDNVLSGSVSVAYLGSKDIQRLIPVDGLYIPKRNVVQLDLDAVLNTRKLCDDPIPGSLWVSADKSYIEMPHRQKAGIMSLLPALVAKPTVTLSPVSTGTLSAVATIVEEEQKVTFDLPLAYKVSHTSNEMNATLQVVLDKTAMETFFTQNAPLVNSIVMSRAVWLHTQKEGKIRMIASNETAFKNFKNIWSKVLNQIKDGALDVVVDTQSKEVVIIKQERNIKEPQHMKITDSEYKYGVIIVGVFFILVVLWLLLTLYRKATKV